MRRLRSFLIRVSGPFRRDRREREMAEEFASHFALHIDDNLRRGMSPAEAARQARLKFGSVDSAREAVRDRASLPLLETTWRDLHYALRGFRKSPGFAATAILSLALGIGASVAIFTVTDNLLLRPLPYREPDRLMMVWESNPHHKNAERNVISPANYRDWKQQNTVFETIAAFGDGQSPFSDGTRAEQLDEQFMTADLLPMLGVSPIRGRLFTPVEDMPQSRRVALISYRLWQRWFNGSEAAVGAQVQISSRPVTIIGIMPAAFYFRNRGVDLWEPLRLDPARDYRKKSGRYLRSAARLKPGATLE